MLISPFTPLFFGTRKRDGIESRYVQTFAQFDQILLEVFVEPGETLEVAVVDATTEAESALTCSSATISESLALKFAVICGLPPGFYRIRVNDEVSNIFRTTADETELEATTLIQYSMKDNLQRTDARFIIGSQRYFFDFRVPGGFKDNGWAFSVDNEQFLTPDADPVELYARESTQKRFTMGWQEGVPVEFAELLNRLLTCNYVYFDGERYARKDSSVPEMTETMDGIDSFVFNQLLQRVNNIDPMIEMVNRRLMLRSTATAFRASAITNNLANQRITIK